MWLSLQRVLEHQEDQALLNAYIREWRKFFAQCGYLPMPFGQLETVLAGKSPKKAEEGLVRKLMLDTWNQSIFSTIKVGQKHSVIYSPELYTKGSSVLFVIESQSMQFYAENYALQKVKEVIFIVNSSAYLHSPVEATCKPFHMVCSQKLSYLHVAILLFGKYLTLQKLIPLKTIAHERRLIFS